MTNIGEQIEGVIYMFNKSLFSIWELLFNNDKLSFWLMEYVESKIEDFRYDENKLNILCNIIKEYSINYEQANARLIRIQSKCELKGIIL